jgi:hypothetical protein
MGTLFKFQIIFIYFSLSYKNNMSKTHYNMGFLYIFQVHLLHFIKYLEYLYLPIYFMSSQRLH